MAHSAEFPIADSVMGSWHRAPGLTSRLIAVCKAAYDRRAARGAYEQLLEGDGHILHDVGVTRDDVLKALADCQ